MGIEAIAALAGLIVPPAFDFLKKKFIKSENDTPERTISSLATTSPDILPQYVGALSQYQESNVKWFNRDVIGTPSQWIIDLRAAIRPVSVVIGFALIAADMILTFGLDTNTKAAIWVNNSSWFGSRLTK